MPFTHTTTANDLLHQIALALDITAPQYDAVIERYTAVANHLARKDSLLGPYKPDIKPQGSFLLGTMIKPVAEEDHLDVDLVCRLQGKYAHWTQRDVKATIGNQLKANNDYRRMLDQEGNRCWTLVYHEAARFHMDILPAIVGQHHFILLERSFSASDSDTIDSLALRITDKRLFNFGQATDPQQWPKSNPFGYAAWFRQRASTAISRSFSLREAVEPLPGYESDKEPLVRVIQLLKRHRDIMFAGSVCKPISIIITTLAARAYQKETNLLLAVNNVLQGMEAFIEERYSIEHMRMVKWIGNPVNDKENFADKWQPGMEGSQRETSFYKWLRKAKADFSLLKYLDASQLLLQCKSLLGAAAVNEAIKNTHYYHES